MKKQPIISVAIVDDHTLFRNGVASMLALYPQLSTTILAEDGKVFIETLKKAKQLPEVCLLDVSMPNMDGYQTMAYIHKKWPQIKTLALSMYADEFPVINMMTKGACGFLAKDEDISVVVDAIEFRPFPAISARFFTISNPKIGMVNKIRAFFGNKTHYRIAALSHCQITLHLRPKSE